MDVVKKAYDMLNRDGYLVILTPHKFSGPHDISAHFLPLGSKALGLHLKEYSFSEVAGLLRAAGFLKILSLSVWPGFYPRLRPNPSVWSAKKAQFFESVFGKGPLTKLMKLHRTLTVRIVSILFPGICIGQKK